MTDAKYNMCGTEAASDLRGGFFWWGTVQSRRAGRGVRSYEGVTRGAVRRDDVGSELSAASGRGSEVSEWPRSKFPASAVRQRRNFGHRNRVIVPYGIVSWGA